MNELKIEKGRFYRRRDGVKCECVADDINIKNAVCLVLTCEKERAIFYVTKQGECIHQPFDILSLWIDKPTYNWSAMPAWANWCAKDKDGSMWWYANKPEMSNYAGWCANGDMGMIPPQYAPTNYTGDWKDSLVERPKGEV